MNGILKAMMCGLGGVLGCAAMAAAAEAPAAAAPAAGKRVLLMGDSMMRGLSHTTEKALAKVPGVESRTFTSIGSGLARLDAFDWMAKIDELCKEFKPDTVLVALGANDKQPMQTASGVVETGSAGWAEEYARRTGEVMDRLIKGGATCVIWMGLPDMRSEKHDADCKEINRISQAEAAKRPQVVWVDMGKIISRKPGTYSPYFIGQDGRPQMVRDPDGVHLSRVGAEMVSQALIKQFWSGKAN